MRLPFLIPALAVAGLSLLASAPRSYAMDCKKASSPVEKDICGDKQLLERDALINKTFADLKAMKKPDEARLLVINQREWIATRETECVETQGGKRVIIGGCIGGGMEVRRRFLAGEPETGAGAASPLWPWFRKGDANAVNVAYAFASPTAPAEIALNAAIVAFLSRNAPGAKQTYAMRYAYGSPRLVSLHGEGAWEGGAHPAPWRGDINFDLVNAKPFKFSDAFAPESLKAIIDECRAQVASDMKSDDKTVIADREKRFGEIVGDLGRWSFAADRATIGFDHGEINDYVDGDLECHFIAPRVNELTKPDFQKF
jgi:uncharacterized protein YecT (DUF1311 family)